jgi:hypothetical protein
VSQGDVRRACRGCGPCRRGSAGLRMHLEQHQAASQPSTFFDVTKGSNDLAGVGCCKATIGYDPASGLGVPNWAAIPATLPPPG